LIAPATGRRLDAVADEFLPQIHDLCPCGLFMVEDSQ
jgi:hypothetical protein